METLSKGQYTVTYNNKDISKDISQFLLLIEYKDKTEGEADELTLELENVDALWENDWYPEKGAKLTASMGKNLLMNCGEFEIDEIELSFPPDVVNIKAISTKITGNLRTKKSTAHENTTLKQIVEKVANDNGLKVEGTIEEIKFIRRTQNNETDLAFLQRLAFDYGYMFSVKGSRLVFTSIYEIIAGNSIRTIDRNDCRHGSILDKSAKVYRKAVVKHHNPTTNKVVEYTIKPIKVLNADGLEYEIIAPLSAYVDKIKNTKKHEAFIKKYPNAPAGYEEVSDTMTLQEFINQENEQRIQAASSGTPLPDMGAGYESSITEDDLNITNANVEDEQQAEAVGNAALLRNNINQQEGNITIEGNEIFVAGVNFQFTGIGKLSGKYHVCRSTHSIDRDSGYKTSLEIKRVGFIDLVKHKRTTQKTTSQYDVYITK